MTLPITDELIAQLSRIADGLEDITGELVRMNESHDNDVDAQVQDIRQTLERQYRDTIDNLEKRLPKDGHAFPFLSKSISHGGLGEPPTGPTDNAEPV